MLHATKHNTAPNRQHFFTKKMNLQIAGMHSGPAANGRLIGN